MDCSVFVACNVSQFLYVCVYISLSYLVASVISILTNPKLVPKDYTNIYLLNIGMYVINKHEVLLEFIQSISQAGAQKRESSQNNSQLNL